MTTRHYYFLIIVFLGVNNFAYAQPVFDFTYQGSLLESGAPAEGFFDFEFAIFFNQTGGNGFGTETLLDVPVNNGYFTVNLNFGTTIIPTNNSERYLEIRIRPSGTGTSFTTLTPRQTLGQTPRTIYTHTISRNSVNSNAIIDNSIIAEDVDSNQVQLRINGTCPFGFNVRGIEANGQAICVKDQIGFDGFLLSSDAPETVADATSPINFDDAVLEPLETHLCLLSRVNFRDVDGAQEVAECNVTIRTISGVRRWVLEARGTNGNDADAVCSARCIEL